MELADKNYALYEIYETSVIPNIDIFEDLIYESVFINGKYSWPCVNSHPTYLILLSKLHWTVSLFEPKQYTARYY